MVALEDKIEMNSNCLRILDGPRCGPHCALVLDSTHGLR